MRARRAIDWDTYLEDFHTRHPGITEDVLSACTDAVTPYEWLREGVDPAARILDIGCGSGPAMPAHASHWVGIDRSMAELGRARDRARTVLIRADATRLPIADRTIDVVTCSMALMLVRPLDQALGELRRVLRGDGELRLLLPAHRPLTAADRLRYLALFRAARSPTTFPPTPLRSHAGPTLEPFGLEVSTDERRRFSYPMSSTEAAERFIDSWYLPITAVPRHDIARRRAAAMAPTTIGIPLRRIIARFPPD